MTTEKKYTVESKKSPEDFEDFKRNIVDSCTKYGVEPDIGELQFSALTELWPDIKGIEYSDDYGGEYAGKLGNSTVKIKNGKKVIADGIMTYCDGVTTLGLVLKDTKAHHMVLRENFSQFLVKHLQTELPESYTTFVKLIRDTCATYGVECDIEDPPKCFKLAEKWWNHENSTEDSSEEEEEGEKEEQVIDPHEGLLYRSSVRLVGKQGVVAEGTLRYCVVTTLSLTMNEPKSHHMVLRTEFADFIKEHFLEYYKKVTVGKR